jgi:hypothetical protein
MEVGEGVGGNQRSIQVFDLATGAPKWNSKDLPIGSSFGQIQAPQHQLLLMAGAPKQKGSKCTFVGVDLETGAVKWENPTLFTKDLVLHEVRGSGKMFKRFSIEGGQDAVFDSENTAILYLTTEGPVKVDVTTGKKLWTADKLKG